MERIHEGRGALNLELKKFTYVITVDFRELDINCFSNPYMRDYFEKIIDGSNALIYNDYIVIIISYSDECKFFTSDAIKLQEFLKVHQLRAGISRPFTKLGCLREHHTQSIKALILGTHIDSDVTIYTYDNYAIYHIAEVCAGKSDLKMFCHPKLAQLIEYDSEHKTSFADSLYTYLKQLAQHYQHSQGAPPAPQLLCLSPQTHRGYLEF